MTGGDSLQFDRAEKPVADAACTTCKRPLGATYYQANGVVICELCRAAIEAEWNAGTTASRFLRALGWGLGAAALGAVVYFAFPLITGFQLSLIAIGVGYVVGRAVRKGSGGRGGPAYQALAVFLTYTAIVFSYGLFIVKEADAITFDAFVMLIPFLYTIPFRDVGSNILNVIIIAIGLYEAWVLNKPGALSITGPYHVGGATPSPST
jgi:hypothetical protein